MKKALSIVAALLFTLTAMAQNGYKISVQQVYPGGGTIFSKTYDYKRELDAAVASQSSSLRGRNANYVINIKTPNGSSSKSVQNITWVQSVNGKVSHHKGRTSPQGSYSSPTVWKGYACNLYGKQSGGASSEEFLYRVQVDGEKDYRTQYVNKSTAVAQAQRIYKEKFTKEHHVAVTVYKFSGNNKTVYTTINNKNEHQSFLDEKETQRLVLEEQQHQDSIINYFNDEMNRLGSYRDSVIKKDIERKSLVRQCYSVLNTLSENLPEDVFINTGLDTTYLHVLTQDVLGKAKNKKNIKKIIEDFNTKTDSIKNIQTNNNISDTGIDILSNNKSYYGRLKNLSEEIDNALGKGDPKDMDQTGSQNKPAYIEKVNGWKKYDQPVIDDNGVTYIYYNKNDKWLRVNTETEDFDIGKGAFGPNGNFEWENEKKVEHYDRKGDKIRNAGKKKDNKDNPKQAGNGLPDYLKKVDGWKKYDQHVIDDNGITYIYYNKNDKWLRVNAETEEYEIGNGHFLPGEIFEWENENKVKHFTRDGKEINKSKKVEPQKEKAPKQEKVKEDAYLEKVKGINPQEKVEKGITYQYYEINENKNEWLRVNTETKEYDTGVGKFDSKGFFKWKDENKVKHYNKEGKEIRPQASPK